MITLSTKNQVYQIVGFPDKVASIAGLVASALADIAAYGAAAQAVAGGTATPEQTQFVQMTQAIVASDDLDRIAALVAILTPLAQTLATDYADFLNPV